MEKLKKEQEIYASKLAKILNGSTVSTEVFDDLSKTITEGFAMYSGPRNVPITEIKIISVEITINDKKQKTSKFCEQIKVFFLENSPETMEHYQKVYSERKELQDNLAKANSLNKSDNNT